MRRQLSDPDVDPHDAVMEVRAYPISEIELQIAHEAR